MSCKRQLKVKKIESKPHKIKETPLEYYCSNLLFLLKILPGILQSAVQVWCLCSVGDINKTRVINSILFVNRIPTSFSACFHPNRFQIWKENHHACALLKPKILECQQKLWNPDLKTRKTAKGTKKIVSHTISLKTASTDSWKSSRTPCAWHFSGFDGNFCLRLKIKTTYFTFKTIIAQ